MDDDRWKNWDGQICGSELSHVPSIFNFGIPSYKLCDVSDDRKALISWMAFAIFLSNATYFRLTYWAMIHIQFDYNGVTKVRLIKTICNT